MSEWKVYVCEPPKSGKNGRNFLLSAQEGGVEWKRRSARTHDRTLAEERARDWLAEIERAIAPLESDPTVGAVIERHLRSLEHAPDVEPGTRMTYRTALRRIERSGLGTVRASALDRAQVLDAVRSMRVAGPGGAPLAGSSIRLTLRRARDAWAWAQERGVVKRPWPRLKGREVRAARTERRPYTDAEVVAVLEWIGARRPAWRPFFELVAATGMRSSEACGLHGRDVLRDDLEVRFRDAKSREPSGACVPADVMDLLPKVAPDAPVFCGPRGGRATPHAADEVKLAAVRALDLTDAHLLDVHSLRRSWVDGLHQAGVPLATAMRSARHETSTSHMPYQRRGVGHDVRAAQALVLERRAAAAPLTRPLTESTRKPLSPLVLAGSPSNRPGPAQPVTASRDALATPHPDVASKRLPEHAGARPAGEGWDGLEHPHGAAIDAFARANPAAAWAWSSSPLVQRTVRLWVLENHPEAIPAPESGATRARKATS